MGKYTTQQFEKAMKKQRIVVSEISKDGEFVKKSTGFYHNILLTWNEFGKCFNGTDSIPEMNLQFTTE